MSSLLINSNNLINLMNSFIILVCITVDSWCRTETYPDIGKPLSGWVSVLHLVWTEMLSKHEWFTLKFSESWQHYLSQAPPASAHHLSLTTYLLLFINVMWYPWDRHFKCFGIWEIDSLNASKKNVITHHLYVLNNGIAEGKESLHLPVMDGDTLVCLSRKIRVAKASVILCD